MNRRFVTQFFKLLKIKLSLTITFNFCCKCVPVNGLQFAAFKVETAKSALPCGEILGFLAYRKRISTCFIWADNSYLTHVISPGAG